MVPSAVVRLATDRDLDACVALVVTNLGGEHEEWQKRFASHLVNPQGAVYVATSGADVVAYGRVQFLTTDVVAAEPALPVGYFLSGVVVDPAARRQGIGADLCRERIAWVAARATEVWYYTNVRNEASRALHRRAGFSEVRTFTSPTLDGGRGVLGVRPAASSELSVGGGWKDVGDG